MSSSCDQVAVDDGAHPPPDLAGLGGEDLDYQLALQMQSPRGEGAWGWDVLHWVESVEYVHYPSEFREYREGSK